LEPNFSVNPLFLREKKKSDPAEREDWHRWGIDSGEQGGRKGKIGMWPKREGKRENQAVSPPHLFVGEKRKEGKGEERRARAWLLRLRKRKEERQSSLLLLLLLGLRGEEKGKGGKR